LNRCGYWYFLHRIKIPKELKSGEVYKIQMDWENRGVAPAYHPYCLKIRFDGPKVEDVELDAGNQKWMPRPSGVYSEIYPISIPRTLQPGQYRLKFKLYSNNEGKNVFVALDPGLLDEENYYLVTSVNVNKQ